jgi:hypothetical protein
MEKLQVVGLITAEIMKHLKSEYLGEVQFDNRRRLNVRLRINTTVLDFFIVLRLFLATYILTISFAHAQDFGTKMVGRWYMRHDFEFPEYDNKTTSHAVQQYYSNGTMTEERQVLGKYKDLGVVSSCYIISDYSWSISGNVLYQKLLATNATLDFYTLNGEDASQLDVAQKGCNRLNNNKNILKTYSYKIIKIDDKENLYSQIDSDGKESIQRDLRTQYGMSKYHIPK